MSMMSEKDRMVQLASDIYRSVILGLPIPVVWFEEYAELYARRDVEK